MPIPGTVTVDRQTTGVFHVGSKLSFLTGAAVGYVLGSRAGRPRYEQIKTKSQQLWQSEPVQTKVSEAGGAIKSAAPVAAEKVGSAAKQVGEAAKTKLSSGSSDETAASGTAGTTYTADGSTSARTGS
jgi:hypothetical protein